MREITIRLGVDDDQYADVVNAIWMQMNLIGCDFTVTPDHRAVPQLDKRWDEYSQVSWAAGGRRGTPQAIAAAADRTGTRDRAASDE
ncbi:hypothetical protein ONA91_25805 [Micromonospora sp. DR5-3]|uniref:hypothetical protein n=1 Tax=unclassified Micromonospora TaxID=2617518 RepID=UPI0011DB8228|nr:MULTISPECIES: hypothetical protein [unclassified Micromonospora]MCW3817869.1 hypothetical protein [Micromonospora sp. DR5-3]TYC22966.1 hypothetical protein FXF52_18080 [Micromonospora sp. MP36]